MDEGVRLVMSQFVDRCKRGRQRAGKLLPVLAEPLTPRIGLDAASLKPRT